MRLSCRIDNLNNTSFVIVHKTIQRKIKQVININKVTSTSIDLTYNFHTAFIYCRVSLVYNKTALIIVTCNLASSTFCASATSFKQFNDTHNIEFKFMFVFNSFVTLAFIVSLAFVVANNLAFIVFRSQTNPVRNRSSSFSVGLLRSAYVFVSIVSVFNNKILASSITDFKRFQASRQEHFHFETLDRKES